MSEDLRLIVDIMSKKNYSAEKKKGEVESNDAYTKRVKGISAWQALQNIEFDDGEKVFSQKEIKNIWKHIDKPQLNGELDLTDAIKKAGYGDRLDLLAQQDQGLGRQQPQNPVSEDSNPFNAEASVQPANPFLNTQETPEIQNNTNVSDIENQLQYNDNKLNNLFVASYSMMENDTILSVEINGKKVKGTKQEILAQLAEDGSISTEEQKDFIQGAVKAAKSSYKTDGKNRKLKNGEKNSQEDIEMFNNMPIADFSKLRQKSFSEKYLEDNNKNTRDKRDAKVSARRVLTELSNSELNKIVKKSGDTTIITKEPEPVAMSKEDIDNLQLGMRLPVAVLENDDVMSSYNDFIGTKTGKDITITAPNKNWVIELTKDDTYQYEDYRFYKFTPDKNYPDDYIIKHPHVQIESRTDKNGNKFVETKDLTKRTITSERYKDGKIMEISVVNLDQNGEPENEVAIQKNYKYLTDGTVIEEIDDDKFKSNINKYDANGKLISSETVEYLDGDDKQYSIALNGKKVTVNAGLTEKSTNNLLAKIPAAVLNKVPFDQSGELQAVGGLHNDIYGLLATKDKDDWFIEINKDNTYNIGVYNKNNPEETFNYLFDANGNLIQKDEQAPELNTIFPQQKAEKAQEAEEPTTNKDVAQPANANETTQPQAVNASAQLKYNDNELNNLFVSSFKMIEDDTKLTISFGGEKVTGTKEEILNLISKDGSIKTEAQKEFILAARTAAEKSYVEDGKKRNLKKGAKNSAQDLEVFTKLPLKSFYNLNSSFINSVKNNEKDALVTARRSLTKLSNNELNKIMKKSGDAVIAIEQPKLVQVQPDETPASMDVAIQAEEQSSQVAVNGADGQQEPVATPVAPETEEPATSTTPTTPVVAPPPPEEMSFDDYDGKLTVDPVINPVELNIASPIKEEDKDKSPVVVPLNFGNGNSSQPEIITPIVHVSPELPAENSNPTPPVTVSEEAAAPMPQTPAETPKAESAPEAAATTASQETVVQPTEPAEGLTVEDNAPVSDENEVANTEQAPVVQPENSVVEQKVTETQPKLTDMPDATQNFDGFVKSLEDKTPKLAETLKQFAQIGNITKIDNAYVFNSTAYKWGEKIDVQITIQPDGSAVQLENGKISCKYASDGSYVVIYGKDAEKYDKDGKNLSSIIYTDETSSIIKTENVRTEDGKDYAYELIYEADGTTIAEKYILNKTNNNLYTRVFYKDGKPATEGEYYVAYALVDGEYKRDDKLLNSTIYNDDGSKTKTVLNPKTGQTTSVITTKDGVDTTITWQEKTEELISLIQDGTPEEVQKAIAEVQTQNWTIGTIRGQRNGYAKNDVHAEVVNSAWNKIGNGIKTSNAEEITAGLNELNALKAQGAIISKDKLSDEDIKNHYQPTADAAYKELLALIQSSNPEEDILNSESIKKLKELREKFGLTFDYPVDTNLPKIAKNWETILRGDIQNFDSAVKSLNDTRRLGTSLSIAPTLDEKAKGDIEIAMSSINDDFVQSLTTATDLNEIIKSESFKKLMEIEAYTGGVNFVIPDTNLTPPMTFRGETLYDVTKLKEDYKALSDGINEGNMKKVQSAITKLQEVKAQGFPITLEGRANYQIKYVNKIELNDVTDSNLAGRSRVATLNVTNLVLKSKDPRGNLQRFAEKHAMLAAGLDEYPATSYEFANLIYLIRSKHDIDMVNKALSKYGKTIGQHDDKNNAIASWCLRSERVNKEQGGLELLRHLGQYDPYFHNLYEKSKTKYPAPKK